MSSATDPLPPDVREALERGNKIEAIKRLRAATGLGLAEAKSMIEFQQQGRPQPGASAGAPLDVPGVADALNAGNTVEAIKRLRQHAGINLQEAKQAIEAALGAKRPGASSGLAPGEVPRSSFSAGWLLVIAAVALLVYFMLSGGGAQ